MQIICIGAILSALLPCTPSDSGLSNFSFRFHLYHICLNDDSLTAIPYRCLSCHGRRPIAFAFPLLGQDIYISNMVMETLALVICVRTCDSEWPLISILMLYVDFVGRQISDRALLLTFIRTDWFATVFAKFNTLHHALYHHIFMVSFSVWCTTHAGWHSL